MTKVGGSLGGSGGIPVLGAEGGKVGFDVRLEVGVGGGVGATPFVDVSASAVVRELPGGLRTDAVGEGAIGKVSSDVGDPRVEGLGSRPVEDGERFGGGRGIAGGRSGKGGKERNEERGQGRRISGRGRRERRGGSGLRKGIDGRGRRGRFRVPIRQSRPQGRGLLRAPLPLLPQLPL